MKAGGFKLDFKSISIYVSVSSKKDSPWIWGIETQRRECMPCDDRKHRHLSFYSQGHWVVETGRDTELCVPGQLWEEVAGTW